MNAKYVMRKLQNSSLLILHLFVMQVFTAYSGKRDVIVTGYVFQGEKLEISYNEAKLTPFDFRVNNNKTGLQFFYEQKQLKGKNIEVKATIDSGEIRLLDTLLVIPDINKTPLISFLHPATTSKRELFLADSDTMLKY